MKITKALLYSVLHARHDDARPFLAQRLPSEFDTDDYPGLLNELGLTEADLTGRRAMQAQELTAMDADPHGTFRDSWPDTQTRERRATLVDELNQTNDVEPAGE